MGETVKKIYVVFAVHGDADYYQQISFHRTKAGAMKKSKLGEYLKQSFKWMAS